MKKVIKNKKRFIDKWQTNIGKIIYMQKLRRIYNYVKNASATTSFNLKKRCI